MDAALQEGCARVKRGIILKNCRLFFDEAARVGGLWPTAAGFLADAVVYVAANAFSVSPAILAAVLISNVQLTGLIAAVGFLTTVTISQAGM